VGPFLLKKKRETKGEAHKRKTGNSQKVFHLMFENVKKIWKNQAENTQRAQEREDQKRSVPFTAKKGEKRSKQVPLNT